MGTIHPFVEQNADLLRNNRQHWAFQSAFDIINGFDTGIQVFDEEGQADADD